MHAQVHLDAAPFGIGLYTFPEAGRLLRTSPRTLRRWLDGYRFRGADGTPTRMPPLWQPQLPAAEREREIGFRDLIELRFVRAFQSAGLGLGTIRRCLLEARKALQEERPFSSRRFRTDGRTIFLALANSSEGEDLLDLRTRQYAIAEVIAQSFRDLDIEADAVARWRPYEGRSSIVIDPRRAFGQPIAAKTGVPTAALADAVVAEGSVDRVARLYDVAAGVVHDAVTFQASLRLAA